MMGPQYKDGILSGVSDHSVECIQKIAKTNKISEYNLVNLYEQLLAQKYTDFWEEEKQKYSGVLQNHIKRMVRDKASLIKELP